MTAKEHKLMMTMFASMNERFGVIADTLTSRGVWSGDDAQAFAHAVRADREKLSSFALQAFDDYQTIAARLDVEVEA
jgi:hypothetical protein